MGVFKVYEETGAQNSEELRSILEEADIVIIHDPQPLPLVEVMPEPKRQVDLAMPYRPEPSLSSGVAILA